MVRPFFVLTLGLLIGCASGHLPDDGGGQPHDASVASQDAAESGCADLGCDVNARCDTATGAPRCVCNEGYAGTGLACNDVDECAVDPTRCAPNECVNLPGSFACDVCPDDPDKVEPGVCGCGMPDDDADADGTYDCIDGCPDDPAKNDPGACGCGQSETDGDGDGAPDCVDDCPSDPAKTEPGACGCGMAETDHDSDGSPDCVDGCPDDPLKTEPGVCGCGEPEPTGGLSSTIGEPRNADYINGPYFRGNVYRPSSTTILDSFEQYISLPSSCTLDFYVLRGSSAGGPWTHLWSARRTSSGAGYRSSGSIGITLNAGSYYALGVGASCSSVTYACNDDGWAGYLTSAGVFQNNVWDNSYPGHSTSFSPSDDGTSGRAYAQRIHAGAACR